MKRILLSSAAIVAFAGAAAAEGHTGVTFSGSADLGFNDTDIDSDGDDSVAGFYSDLEVTIGFAAELDNGLTAAASIDFEDLASGTADGADYELSLTSENAGLYYGDTNFAAQNVWVAAGPMANDDFSEADGEEALRGEVTFGGVEAQVSYVLADADGNRGTDDLDQLSVGVSGDFGNFNVVMAYQEAASDDFNAANGDFNNDEVFGISVGTSFGGADVRLAYAESEGDDSIGVSVSYPFGPVTVDAGYATNSDQDDDWDLAVSYEDGPIAVTVSTDEESDWGIEGSYDVGSGLTVYAGVVDAGEDYYVGGEYDLGSGASLQVSFAEDGDGDEADGDDDIGANDYQVGTTVELSFEF
ncbi:porin [Pseudooctadecabacter sp.]|uniref:porin n=1 Tax=Pseudooctadecabacter sp. TaxID=1966338 RepID=UPI0025E548C4|nr:porin [Pseudooctadecabacter sp.]